MHFEKEKKPFICFSTSLKMKGAYFYFITEAKHIILQLELRNSHGYKLFNDIVSIICKVKGNLKKKFLNCYTIILQKKL